MRLLAIHVLMVFMFTGMVCAADTVPSDAPTVSPIAVAAPVKKADSTLSDPAVVDKSPAVATAPAVQSSGWSALLSGWSIERLTALILAVVAIIQTIRQMCAKGDAITANNLVDTAKNVISVVATRIEPVLTTEDKASIQSKVGKIDGGLNLLNEALDITGLRKSQLVDAPKAQ